MPQERPRKSPKNPLNKGIFVISFDSELAWGTRNDPLYREDFKNERKVTREILALFEKYDIAATWAVVGHLFLDSCKPENGVKHPELKRPHMHGNDDWLSIDPCADANTDPDFYAPDMIADIRACTTPQEIGSHTFSHIVVGSLECTREFFENDAAAFDAAAKKEGISARSFVFPQNQIGFLDVLERHGFTSYRGVDRNWYRFLPKLPKKYAHILDHYLNPLAPTVQPKKEGNLWNISGSYFFIHKRSWTKWLPVSFRVRKAVNGLKRAARRKEVFHLWTHPFNVASHSDLVNGLETIFAEAARLRAKGLLEVKTMGALADALTTNASAPAAIVLDGEQKSALAAVRSLGEKGIQVIAGGKRRFGMALHSRSVSERFLYADPLKNKKKFVDDVIAEAKRHAQKPVLLMMSDQTASALFERKAEIDAVATIVWPSDGSFAAAFDKEKTLRLAQSLSIPIPHTLFDSAEKPAQFPAVLKPRKSTYWQGNSGFQTTASFAMNEKDLAEKSKAFFEKTGEYPLVQEYVKGEEYGVEALCKDGEIIALSAHRRIRSLSPVGGASVVKETIDAGMMRGLAEKILKALSWSGPAMVEFKKNDATGEYVLMEINGRFWGSLPLNVFAGTDFPYLYYHLAIGEHFEPVFEYKKGIVSRYFMGDVKNLLSVLFKRDPMRTIAYPSRLKALKDFFVPVRGKRVGDIVSLKDMRPALFQYIDRFLK